MVKNDFSGFLLIENEKEKDIIKNNPYLYVSSEFIGIIAKDDIPAAIALTPHSHDIEICDLNFNVIVTTCGNLVNTCCIDGMDEKLNFLSRVKDFQLKEDDFTVPYIESDVW